MQGNQSASRKMLSGESLSTFHPGLLSFASFDLIIPSAMRAGSSLSFFYRVLNKNERHGQHALHVH